jgi:hypothetical protein
MLFSNPWPPAVVPRRTGEVPSASLEESSAPLPPPAAGSVASPWRVLHPAPSTRCRLHCGAKSRRHGGDGVSSHRRPGAATAASTWPHQQRWRWTRQPVALDGQQSSATDQRLWAGVGYGPNLGPDCPGWVMAILHMLHRVHHRWCLVDAFVFVWQHDVTWGCSPEHDDGGLLLRLSWSYGRIKVVVLGFLSCEDENLLDACPYGSSQSVEFWKTPQANFNGCLMPGDC